MLTGLEHVLCPIGRTHPCECLEVRYVLTEPRSTVCLNTAESISVRALVVDIIREPASTNLIGARPCSGHSGDTTTEQAMKSPDLRYKEPRIDLYWMNLGHQEKL